ncbi:hypothetical protein O7626_04805 [Micromonospora sp. WMMD1102]|uniref:hypothetical protein n=1 Tax=Micromonospora sp. WMMD1102 TaxID=3016105 RepID=UPI0024155247|nr:hypothetical protein [Micromonospora sp. WMMD1102]MDG4785258.1 hypothetical protein [Micromonospora sp. WMMD1102]
MTVHPRLAAGASIAATTADWLAASLAGFAATDRRSRRYLAETSGLPGQTLLLDGLFGLTRRRPQGT